MERGGEAGSEHPLGKHTDCLFHRDTITLAAALFARCVQRDPDQYASAKPILRLGVLETEFRLYRHPPQTILNLIQRARVVDSLDASHALSIPSRAPMSQRTVFLQASLLPNAATLPGSTMSSTIAPATFAVQLLACPPTSNALKHVQKTRLRRQHNANCSP